ncbi:hypothetical protein [Aureimonas phyllosphaerae]|uniref:Uncharacterized protein n=1 Tax=Aureimonas phyllosphaerae TaxID=1166078 RepID=A0A7W6BVD4_9HYPH|nr:hypothetical protein [Aureimonas phyllosphaerae]MBB3935425.1 hypothetical protein [Aureimonas phyllosphaerae]MBB3959433.1 hypothetical protein [Aureimonas phyllosphaerae]SFF53201.1 hypothetical protein SAMN05216566_12316 [Aureimonas phyllosphaerae]
MAFKTPHETAAEARIAKAGWKRDKKTNLWKCFREPDRGKTFSGTAVELARILDDKAAANP